MKSILDVYPLAARLYKVLDDVKIIATSITEALGVVQDDARMMRRSDLFLDIWDAGFATVLYSLQFESQWICNIEYMKIAIYREVSLKDCIDEIGFADTSLRAQ